MNTWLREILVCPRHRLELKDEGKHLVCPENDRYLVVNGIPVFLFNDGSPTHAYIERTIEQVSRIERGEDAEAVAAINIESNDDIDQFVKRELPYTCGNLYFSIQESVTRYPFPELRLPAGEDRILLDIGCNWGRWSIPAAQKGYRAIGIDPSLDAVLAARRIARQVGVEPEFIVADARFLPFADDSMDVCFSYSVIQHFNKTNAKKSFSEMARVAKTDGQILVQMPNKYGLRCLYHQMRMGFKEGLEGRDVFYWTPKELSGVFGSQFGETEMTVDCFFGLNLQAADIDLMPFSHRMAIRLSEMLRSVSQTFSPLVKMADSVYLSSLNQKT